MLAIIVAGGKGKRVSSRCPKQFVKIGDFTVLEHSVKQLLLHPKIKCIIIVLPKEYFSAFIHGLAKKRKLNLHIVIGGLTRVDSVLRALKYISLLKSLKKYSNVLIHDAARPYIDIKNLYNVINNQKRNSGVVLLSPLRNAVKKINCISNRKISLNRNLIISSSDQCSASTTSSYITAISSCSFRSPVVISR